MKKDLIIFDLDGTLAVSKTPMDEEMSGLLNLLLKNYKVAVISGGSYEQFRKQFLGSLNARGEVIENLYLFPTCGTSFYRYEKGNWIPVYREILSGDEKKKIFTAFQKALEQAGYTPPKKPFGEIIEDRETQVSFSALGQLAPIELKSRWDPDQKKRLHIKSFLDKLLPEFEVRVGGTTTIDVTRKGIDKGYGVVQMGKHIGVPISRMLFVGDALFPGGNDYPAKEAGVECKAVTGPEEAKVVIKKLINDRAKS